MSDTRQRSIHATGNHIRENADPLHQIPWKSLLDQELSLLAFFDSRRYSSAGPPIRADHPN
jgi:hypothetical protein